MPVALLFLVVGVGGAYIAGATHALCDSGCAPIAVWPFYILIAIGVVIVVLSRLDRRAGQNERDEPAPPE
jgi:hypothetical protein